MSDAHTTADALTPEQARELFMPWVSMLFVMPHEREAILAAWGRDRERLRAVEDALLTHDIVPPLPDAPAMDWKSAVHHLADACFPVQANLISTLSRLATVTAQRDALVPLADYYPPSGMTPQEGKAAEDALAAIRAEGGA